MNGNLLHLHETLRDTFKIKSSTQTIRGEKCFLNEVECPLIILFLVLGVFIVNHFLQFWSSFFLWSLN